MLIIPGVLASSLKAGGDFESIATVTVGAGGSSSISFSSIPSTYKHLQVRFSAISNRATYGTDIMTMRVNGVSTSSYANHILYGTGAAVGAYGGGSSSNIQLGDQALGTTVSSYFGVGVLDILDYANTNKFKTTRFLGGVDINGTIAGYGGSIHLSSGLFQSTNAITSLDFYPFYGTAFAQYSTFALYGIKG